MDPKIAFGKRVRAIREERGYSQELLAELACLHRTYIGGVERGERNVSLVNICRIGKALEVNPSELFARPDEVIPLNHQIVPGNLRSAKPANKKEARWYKIPKK